MRILPPWCPQATPLRAIFFWRLVPLEADPDSVMHENYRWEGRWVRKDGRTDIDEGGFGAPPRVEIQSACHAEATAKFKRLRLSAPRARPSLQIGLRKFFESSRVVGKGLRGRRQLCGPIRILGALAHVQYRRGLVGRPRCGNRRDNPVVKLCDRKRSFERSRSRAPGACKEHVLSRLRYCFGLFRSCSCHIPK